MGSSKQTTTQQSTQTLPAWETNNYQKLIGSSMNSIYGANGQVNGVPAQQNVAGLTSNASSWLKNAADSQNIGTNLSANNALNGYTPNVNSTDASNAFSGYSPSIQNTFANGNIPQAANSMSGFNSNISAENAGTSQWNDQTAQQYMNPYMSQVLTAQQAIANQQHGQDLANEQRAAGAHGALGGDRNFINQSTMNNDWNLQQQNMQAQALSNAYTTGQSAYQQDAARRLSADTSNADRNLAAQTQNANLNFGALSSTNQNNLANAQLAYNAMNSQNDTNSQNAQLGFGALQSTNAINAQNAQAHNTADNLSAQLRMQGLLGTNELNSQAATDQLNALTQQQAAGKSAQNYAQYGLDTQYQNAMNAYLFPQQQLQWASGMQNSMPQQWSSDSTSTTVSNPSTFGSIMSGIMGAASAFGGAGGVTGGMKTLGF